MRRGIDLSIAVTVVGFFFIFLGLILSIGSSEGIFSLMCGFVISLVGFSIFIATIEWPKPIDWETKNKADGGKKRSGQINALKYVLPLPPLFAFGIASLLVGIVIGSFTLIALGMSLTTIHICLIRIIVRRW